MTAGAHTAPSSSPASGALDVARARAGSAAATASTRAGNAARAAKTAAAKPLASVPGTMTQARIEQVLLAIFIAVPFLAVVAAVPVAWGWGLGWRDVVIAFVMYAISGHGITVGFHRYFTHGSFKAPRAVRVALAVAGTLAIEGPVIRWVPTPPDTTPSATRKATRTRRGATAPTPRRSPRASGTHTSAGCSTSSR